MRRISHAVSYIAVATLISVSGTAEAKKKKPETTIFDECPVSETIRVASDASIDGLESLAACDDVEVAPASPEDLPMVPKMRVVDNDKDDEFSVETADLPMAGADRSPVGPQSRIASLPTKPSKKDKSKGGSQDGQIEVRHTVTGTPYLAFRPAAEEFDYTPAGDASYAPTGAAGYGPATQSVVPMSAGTVARGDLTSDSILAMRPVRYKTAHDDLIGQIAQRHRIDPLLLHAVIKQESGYRITARSHVGAQGLMQIMPGTGAMLGVARDQLNDPHANVDAGARLLRKLAIKYDGNFDLVLAAYNAGEGAVQKYGNRIPPYRETQDYVRKVMGNYYQLLNDNTGGAAR
jgi:hypothetical protein